MAWVFRVLLLAWPAAEIIVFIALARAIGLPAALAGIVLSSVAGIAWLRAQGLATARRAQALIDRGRMPVGEIFDGACLAVSGLLFLLPGYVSDLLGLLLLLGPVRSLLKTILASRLLPLAGAGNSRPTVIEGEWEEVRGEGEKPGKLPERPSPPDESRPP